MYQDWNNKGGHKGDSIKQLYEEGAIMLGLNIGTGGGLIVLATKLLRLIERL
jgi:hypothetical protein